MPATKRTLLAIAMLAVSLNAAQAVPPILDCLAENPVNCVENRPCQVQVGTFVGYALDGQTGTDTACWDPGACHDLSVTRIEEDGDYTIFTHSTGTIRFNAERFTATEVGQTEAGFAIVQKSQGSCGPHEEEAE